MFGLFRPTTGIGSGWVGLTKSGSNWPRPFGPSWPRSSYSSSTRKILEFDLELIVSSSSLSSLSSRGQVSQLTPSRA